jgi:hypothetical protein
MPSRTFSSAVVCAVLSAVTPAPSKAISAEDSGLYSIHHLVFVAVWKLLMPFPGAFDDDIERLELRLPTKLGFNFV